MTRSNTPVIDTSVHIGQHTHPCAGQLNVVQLRPVPSTCWSASQTESLMADHQQIALSIACGTMHRPTPQDIWGWTA